MIYELVGNWGLYI